MEKRWLGEWEGDEHRTWHEQDASLLSATQRCLGQPNPAHHSQGSPSPAAGQPVTEDAPLPPRRPDRLRILGKSRRMSSGTTPARCSASSVELPSSSRSVVTLHRDGAGMRTRAGVGGWGCCYTEDGYLSEPNLAVTLKPPSTAKKEAPVHT